MRLAVAQIISSADPAANLELIRDYAAQAKSAGAELVVFPEAAMRAFGHSLRDIAEPLDGPWAEKVRNIARELEIVVVAGMFTPGKDGRVRNTLLVTGPGVDTSYDKVHLFDAFGFTESKTVDAGERPVTFEVNGTVFGLATCYDVRFPALFTANAKAGARVNIVCASGVPVKGRRNSGTSLSAPGHWTAPPSWWPAARATPRPSVRDPPAAPPPASATAPSSPRWARPWQRSAASPNSPSWTSIPPRLTRFAPSSRSSPTPASFSPRQ
jgi:predicted amidohydrolase